MFTVYDKVFHIDDSIVRFLIDTYLRRELPCAKSTGRLERLDAPPNIRRFIPAAETAGCSRFEIKMLKYIVNNEPKNEQNMDSHHPTECTIGILYEK